MSDYGSYVARVGEPGSSTIKGYVQLIHPPTGCNEAVSFEGSDLVLFAATYKNVDALAGSVFGTGTLREKANLLGLTMSMVWEHLNLMTSSMDERDALITNMLLRLPPAVRAEMAGRLCLSLLQLHNQADEFGKTFEDLGETDE